MPWFGKENLRSINVGWVFILLAWLSNQRCRGHLINCEACQNSTNRCCTIGNTFLTSTNTKQGNDECVVDRMIPHPVLNWGQYSGLTQWLWESPKVTDLHQLCYMYGCRGHMIYIWRYCKKSYRSTTRGSGVTIIDLLNSLVTIKQWMWYQAYIYIRTHWLLGHV